MSSALDKLIQQSDAHSDASYEGVDELRFPLPSDYPIVSILLEDGTYKIVSRNGDDVWEFTELEGVFRRIYIRNSKWNKRSHLSDQNILVFRDVLGYLWLSDRREITSSNLVHISKNLRSFLAGCTKQGVVATELFKKPNVASKIFESLTPKQARTMILLLAEIYANREILGFFILNPLELYDIEKLIQITDVEQTPYVPIRIWDYQALRLTEFLNDFMSTFDKFESLFNNLVEIYLNCGYGKARKSERPRNVSPFNKSNKGEYVGRFSDIANDFEVDEILKKWMVSPNRSFDTICAQSGPRIFSTYLTAVTYVGLIYLANFSGMRSGELISLVKNSVITEEDKDFGTIYFLQGGTTKTVVDKGALWVTTPFSQKVVDALAKISLMRITCAKRFGRGKVNSDEHLNPHLFMRAYEPWGLARGDALNMSVSISKYLRYGHWQSYCPNLFDREILTITKDDFLEAKKYTPSLNTDKFAIGKPWPLAMHQLRRTLIVNAVEGGVSLFSTQYQAKHQSLVMTRVYSAHHVGRRISKEMRTEFMDAVYGSLVGRMHELREDRFVSIYGADHKTRMIEFVDVTSAKKLLEGTVGGSYSIRETFYGLCFKKGFCPSGGISFVADCPSCSEGLGDKNKLPTLKAVRVQLATQLSDIKERTKLAESLNRQLDIISSAIDFLEK